MYLKFVCILHKYVNTYKYIKHKMMSNIKHI